MVFGKSMRYQLMLARLMFSKCPNYKVQIPTFSWQSLVKKPPCRCRSELSNGRLNGLPLWISIEQRRRTLRREGWVGGRRRTLGREGWVGGRRRTLGREAWVGWVFQGHPFASPHRVLLTNTCRKNFVWWRTVWRQSDKTPAMPRLKPRPPMTQSNTSKMSRRKSQRWLGWFLVTLQDIARFFLACPTVRDYCSIWCFRMSAAQATLKELWTSLNRSESRNSILRR